MPYAALERPSIALGLLTAELRGAGVQVESLYGSLDFAALVGLDAYHAILNSRTTLFAGEWTFAAAAFPEMRSADPDYVARCAADIGCRPSLLLDLRDAAERFTNAFADAIVARRPRIVGCTSTFQQQTASLALLRAVRERDPSVITMIGGTNCEAAMGVAARRAFPWVDYVVSGEADELIVPFVKSLLENGRGAPVPYGVIDEATAASAGDPPRASVWSVDAIPTPDYDDYFDALAISPIRDAITPALVLETSRGCWWGAKSHCTFCGLNGGNMSYRAKSGAHAVEEFHALARRYGIGRFTLVDNIIDVQYQSSVLPQLAGAGYDIFYETKANLRRPQMERFAAAGVRAIQPGMESFHDELLRLLAKGNRAWMNVQLLKWAAELSMEISWVFLIDIPGQRDECYAEMLGWLPLLSHLTPPVYATPIQFVRFSPYHRDAAKYGLDLIAEPEYAQIYPQRGEAMEQLAYYFVERTPTDRAGIAQRLLVAWLGFWRDQHERGAVRPRLEMRRDGERLHIVDTRSCATAAEHTLRGDLARIYDACDEAIDQAALRTRLGIADAAFDEAVRTLMDDKLLLDFDGRLLALAVDVTSQRTLPMPNPAGRVEFASVAS
jgi:ribosomal peptide maturation radical SAM protein 1